MAELAGRNGSKRLHQVGPISVRPSILLRLIAADSNSDTASPVSERHRPPPPQTGADPQEHGWPVRRSTNGLEACPRKGAKKQKRPRKRQSSGRVSVDRLLSVSLRSNTRQSWRIHRRFVSLLHMYPKSRILTNPQLIDMATARHTGKRVHAHAR